MAKITVRLQSIHASGFPLPVAGLKANEQLKCLLNYHCLKAGEMRKMPCMLYQTWVALNGKKLFRNVCLEKEDSDMYILASTRAMLSWSRKLKIKQINERLIYL